MKTAPKIVTFETVFRLRWKICIGTPRPGHADTAATIPFAVQILAYYADGGQRTGGPRRERVGAAVGVRGGTGMARSLRGWANAPLPLQPLCRSGRGPGEWCQARDNVAKN